MSEAIHDVATAVQSTTRMTSFPAGSRATLEILNNVLDNLNPSDPSDHITMATCALVCRHWAALIRARKFRKIALYPGRLSPLQERRCGHSNAFIEFWVTLCQCPSIGDTVEVLYIDGRSRLPRPDPLAQPDEGVLLHIIQRLPWLRILDIRNVSRPVSEAPPMDKRLRVYFRKAGWRTVPRLSALKLVKTCPPFLRSLRIENTYFAEDEPWESDWNRWRIGSASSGPEAHGYGALGAEGPVPLGSMRSFRVLNARSWIAWTVLCTAAAASAPLKTLTCTWGREPWNSIEVLARAISGISGTLKTATLLLPAHIEKERGPKAMANAKLGLAKLSDSLAACEKLQSLTLYLQLEDANEDQARIPPATFFFLACIVQSVLARISESALRSLKIVIAQTLSSTTTIDTVFENCLPVQASIFRAFDAILAASERPIQVAVSCICTRKPTTSMDVPTKVKECLPLMTGLGRVRFSVHGAEE